MSYIIEFLRPDNGQYTGPFNGTIMVNLERPEFEDCKVLDAGWGSNGGSVVDFLNEETFTLFMFTFEPDLVHYDTGITLTARRLESYG